MTTKKCVNQNRIINVVFCSLSRPWRRSFVDIVVSAFAYLYIWHPNRNLLFQFAEMFLRVDFLVGKLDFREGNIRHYFRTIWLRLFWWEFLVSIVIRFWVNALGFRWKIPIFILKINQYYSNWYSNTTHTNTRMMKILWSCLGKSFQTAESISDVLIICWLVAILSVICVAFVQFRFQFNLTPATSKKSLKY